MAVGALRLDLGALDLVNADNGYDSFEFATQGEGVDFGEPQPIDVTLASLMADGAPTETTRYENREVSFRVEVIAPDTQGLSDGEATLLSQIGVRTTLAWKPSDDFGPTTVFRVETSRLKFLFADLDEIHTRPVKRRTYQLTLTCLPFARSLDRVTVGAEFVADSVTIADDCESATGWSATALRSINNPVAKAVDSSIFATGTGSLRFTPASVTVPAFGHGESTVTVVRTGLSIDASGGGYFVLRVRGEWALYLQDSLEAYLTSSGGGRQAVEPLIGEADANGFVRLSFVVPDASTITAFEMRVLQTIEGIYGSVPAPKFWIDSLGLAGNSSAPQNVMSFDVVGSMRCEASFRVSAPAGLGDVVLYTVPDLDDGFRPDLRRRQITGASTGDMAAINGTRTALSVSPTFSAPAAMFRSGSYAVLARVRRSAPGSCVVSVSAQTKSGSTDIGPVESVVSPTITLTDDDYHVVRLGVIELPPLVTDPASNATVLFTATKSGTDYYLDELLVFPLEDHALTWVSCGSGSPSASVSSRLWIDEPSPTLPRGARLIGTDENRLDARYVLPQSAGRHVLKPGRMLAYLLTSAAGGADLQAVYVPAWHSNAGV